MDDKCLIPTGTERLRSLACAIVIGSVTIFGFLGFSKLLYYSKINTDPNNDNLVLQILILSVAFFIPSSILNLYPNLLENVFILSDNTYVQFLLKAFRSLSLILIVIYFVYSHDNGLELIGLNIGKFGIPGILCSAFVLFGFYIGTCNLLWKLIHSGKEYWDLSRPEIKEFVGINSSWRRLFAIVLVSLSVIHEEILFRGYLVLYLGSRFNNFFIFGVISILLSGFFHMYQGKERIVFHVLFATIAVGITIWYRNIFLSTTLHLFNNILGIFMVWILKDRQMEDSKA
jgi:membrane protease YdiL (CAAX protease family)